MKDPMNPYVKHHLWHLSVGSVLFAILWAGLMLALDELGPLTPFDRQARYVIGKATAAICGVSIQLWVVMFLELITNGSVIGRILHDPNATAKFAGAIIITAGFIFAMV